MEPDRTRLAERILKLLALAAGTTFEAEADTARRMATELMARHNINLSDGAKDRNNFAFEHYVPHFKGMRWEYALFEAVTRLCGCMSYWHGEYVCFVVAGTAANIETCLYIVAKLHEQRMGKWLRYKSGQGSDNFHKFCYGFAQGLETKISAIVTPMPALAQATKAAKLWYEATHSTITVDEEFGRAASSAGVDAGRSASLHHGEMGATNRKLLR